MPAPYGVSIDYLNVALGINDAYGPPLDPVPGPAGSVGATGPQGVAGPAGAVGVDGLAGAVGAVGAAGTAGAAGVDGKVGATGAAGVAGVVGATGAQGAVGATGPQGVDGVAGTTGASGVRAGLAFNPVANATTTITSGTKSYWFIALIHETTTISGFSAYITAGSDTMRVGIYRGYLRASTSDTITLVGQSASGAPFAGLPYMRRAITAVAGQSLVFAPGDYMTIGFHSQGTTNGFVASPASGSILTEISYNSSTNYAAAGFPATLTTTSILSGNAQRLCFELY